MSNTLIPKRILLLLTLKRTLIALIKPFRMPDAIVIRSVYDVNAF